jgi:hypothetical protein
VLDRELQILTLLKEEPGDCSIIEQQQFTDQEFFLLLELFGQYPDYTPLADMLHAQTGRGLERCQQQVMRALDEGYIDEVIRPVRNVLSRVRIKVRNFEIDIRSIMTTGYMLVPDRAVHRKRQVD